MNLLKNFYSKCGTIFIYTALFCSLTIAQTNERKEIKIPDISGYLTLKCDFHSHTVFSDGDIWPDLRVEEAWAEGLDAIAITDHIEYQPHKKDMVRNLNRSYEIASEYADKFNIIVIKGSEITRKMPPGHLNALFLKDSNPLDTADFRVAIKSAKDQGAFVQWNHPFWQGTIFPKKEGKVDWFPEHQEFYDNGWLNGIEVVNERDYYPDVFRWCLEKNLTMLGNSDIHSPSAYFYNLPKGDHRPFTLVFAKERTAEGIKEALIEHRTAVFFSDTLLGKEEFLKPIFKKSIEIITPKIETLKGKAFYIQIANNSDIPFKLTSAESNNDFEFEQSIALPAQRVVRLYVKPKSKDLVGKKNLVLPYKIKNLLISPTENLTAEINCEVEIKEK
ncbi:MAG: Sb-PDE family phosphodiesterase [Ignavibacteriales bacterium]|nr:Sb-PDE family phosphodiesterase [Ignavibacteriales bacterium]